MPHLQEFELEDPLTPVTHRLDKLESTNRENHAEIKGWGELIGQRLTELTQKVDHYQRALSPTPPLSPTTVDVAQLRNYYQQQAQIVENFINSLETFANGQCPPIISDDEWERELANLTEMSNGNGHRNGKGHGNGHGKGHGALL